jgi:predicted type IV restriction endonuclease
MPAPQMILELVERFERNLDAYKSGSYNETQVRREFIDPFFEALGWDVNNREGNAEAYKDVIHEDAVKVGGITKAPDYSFRIGGSRKFFVEAKKPSICIKDDPAPAFQVRRYAWSAKLPLSIVTDFDELAVYDCRIKPDQKDRADKARVKYYTFRQYVEKWDEIAAIFSKDAILKGSFDKYAESHKAKRGTAEVDNAFLEEIESWRDALARNIALRNSLSVRELNESVQRTIDRIIFLRIAEDRGIEEYGSLRGICNGANTFARLRELFYKADDRYNSGLFHFRHEKGEAEPPDNLTISLTIDDKPLKDILKRLYYPDSPYEFAVLPADILGQVYEQFLGKVIRLTSDHRAVVEDKPEVKKAGGVFYTPTYIEEYIVKNTVGKLLEGKTPKQAESIRILDPACGSGSFLLGAYQYLLDWHLKWYVVNEPEKWAKAKKPVLHHGYGGAWHLTTAERKRILLNNIYGVDIDSQAVEVTKLSLLLKVLEGETGETLNQQMRLFHERALPDLGSNIKCGNSLIGPDFYDGRQMNLMDDDEMYRVNVFDWVREFAEVFKAGGFDAVIGNPPYGALLGPLELGYLQNKYVATTKDMDTYALFIEHSVKLMKPLGKLSMIVPTGWYSGVKFSKLRRFIATTTNPEVFINLPYDIFHAWVDTTVFTVSKRKNPLDWPRHESCFIGLRTFPKRYSILSVDDFQEDILSANFCEWFADGSDEYLTYADSSSTQLVHKIKKISKPLNEMADVQRGVTPFHIIDEPTYPTCKPALSGTVRRYTIEKISNAFIRFDDTLAEPKPERYFIGPRILLREIISRQFRLQSVKVIEDFVTNKSMQSILALDGGPDINYLLGLLNSNLVSWYFLKISNIAQRDDFPKIVLKETRSLPIRPIDFSDPADTTSHDRMVQLVEQMLGLQKQLFNAKTGHDKTHIQRQIDATDRQIDRLVYELYGLTDEEIGVVEGKA